MRITIDIPDGLLQASSAVSSPSVLPEPGASVPGSPSDALSGGEAASPAGGVFAASLHDASSAGAAEQDSGLAAPGSDDRTSDGGSAPIL